MIKTREPLVSQKRQNKYRGWWVQDQNLFWFVMLKIRLLNVSSRADLNWNSRLIYTVGQKEGYT